jgi:amino acid adenylation domain-containing protein
VRRGSHGLEVGEYQAAVLHQIFERQAARTPDAVALVSEGEADVTYANLDQRADALALRLQESGVEPTAHVAMLARTGISHVIGMLAVLKCGAAFATLDADAPAARQQEIVDELAPSALLFDSALHDTAAALGGQHARVAITTTDSRSRIHAQPDVIAISPTDVAFVAFTSGSGGQPKGIVQSHRSFAQFLEWFGTTFGFRPGTRLAQWAAPTYDAAYCEILGGLLFGATVCLVPRHARNDPAAFLRWAERSRITVLELVPSYATQLLNQIKTTSTKLWDPLRYVLLAGEELSVSLASEFKHVLSPGADIYNLYGPSECVLATYHRVTSEDLAAKSIPIGRAINGRELVVLDDTGAECGPGVTGEICVRSEFLAAGYLHDAARTASVFVDRHSDRADPHFRELHTGDLGRWTIAGELEWLGRRDHMVKRRGVRIEIEEIERRLRDLAEVSECAVTASRPDDAQSTELALVGHIVPAADELLDRTDAPEHIRRRATSLLPTQLIPDVFVLVRSLPKLPNGKVDRNALASIALRRSDRHVRDPRGLTGLEEEIARIFSDVLGVGSVGPTDDFFNLGGHSLLAMTVLDRIRMITGIDLPMLAIFGQPTARQLAALVESQPRDQSDYAAAPASSIRHEYPLMPGQEGLWVADHLFPGNPAYNLPLITAIKGSVSTEILEQSLRGVIERHDILRASYRFDGQNPVQVIAAGTSRQLRIVNLTDYPSSEKETAAESAIREVIDSRFDLEVPDLIRSALITLSHDNHILAMAIHHIICDGPSLQVLADDMARLYEAALYGIPASALPVVQFEDFVRRHLPPAAGAGEAESRQRTASAAQLHRSTSGIPAHRVRGVLSQQRAAAVRTLASRIKGTLFTTLLTLFGVALQSTESEPAPLVVDVPVSARGESFSRCIGCFVEAAHVSFIPDDSATFRQLLKRTHDQMAGVGSQAGGGRSAADARALLTVHAGATPFIQLADLVCAPYVLDRNTATYGIGFYWRDDAATLSYIVEYATDLYSRRHIDDLIARYDDLIDQACADPDHPLIRSGNNR